MVVKIKISKSSVITLSILLILKKIYVHIVTKHITYNLADERRQLPSVSTALVLSVGIGIIEATALYFGAGIFLSLMGISSVSNRVVY